jgi:hypothetical protein
MAARHDVSYTAQKMNQWKCKRGPARCNDLLGPGDRLPPDQDRAYDGAAGDHFCEGKPLIDRFHKDAPILPSRYSALSGNAGRTV